MATALPSAKLHSVQSDCQHSLGRENTNRLVADLGRLRGCGSTRSWRVRMRATVAREGTPAIPLRCRVHTIDCGP
jgi:hypothetical protein